MQSQLNFYANSMHIQCKFNATAMHIQCNFNTSAMQIECQSNANSIQIQYKFNANYWQSQRKCNPNAMRQTPLRPHICHLPAPAPSGPERGRCQILLAGCWRCRTAGQPVPCACIRRGGVRMGTAFEPSGGGTDGDI